MTECDERICRLEEQLAAARAALKELGDSLLHFAQTDILYLSCELIVMQEHPSIEHPGPVHSILVSLMERVDEMGLRITDLAGIAHESSGEENEDVTPASMLN